MIAVMRRIGIGVVIAVLSSFLVVAQTAGAATATRVLPGWPKRVAAGSVHQGPGGGVVVVSIGDSTADGFPYVVSAFRRDGRRLWTNRRVPGCGNCDDGPQPEALQADGTYGPIGVEGDDFWAVDRRGRRVAGCSGAVAADGTCYFASSDFTTEIPSVVARTAAGDVAWKVDDDAYRWVPEFEVPPIVVRDGAGLIYTAFGFGTDARTSAAQDGRLIAVDPATRSILWGRPGPDEVLTALGSGVLAVRDRSIVAFRRDGVDRWSRPLPAGQQATPATTIYDGPRKRVYVGRIGGTSGVTAYRAATGAPVWSTRPGEPARLLSVGRSGRVYLAIDAPGRRAVRAVRFTNGKTVWQRRTRRPVAGARELRNGTVAVSVGAIFPRASTDVLTLLRPR